MGWEIDVVRKQTCHWTGAIVGTAGIQALIQPVRLLEMVIRGLRDGRALQNSCET
jgi:hypothetical protein